MHIRGAVLPGIIVFLVSTAAAQDDPYFLMLGSQIECLSKNSDRYLASSDKTLFIKPSDCGSDLTGKTISIIEMTLNAAPDIEIVEDRNAPDSIVVLTHEDFICMASQSFPDGAELVEFYPDSCRLVVRAP